HGHGHHNVRSVLLPDCGFRDSHGCSRSQTIIEENDCPPLNLDRWPAVTVLAFPSFQFTSFSRCCFVDRFGRNTETFHNFSIENCYSSRRQSSHRKFLLSTNLGNGL